MQILIATVVHHPDDARIKFRQIDALLAAGHEVIYLAPEPVSDQTVNGFTHIAIPRAIGRRRVRALVAMRRLLKVYSGQSDLVVIHDPELVVLAGAISGPRIWDVHEDLVAQMSGKRWIPRPFHGLARSVGSRLEAMGRKRFACMLAEEGYRERFPGAPVIRNTVDAPENVASSGSDRVVYLGRVSAGRGFDSLAEIAPRLCDAVVLDVIGPLDADIAEKAESVERMNVIGFLPNDVALDCIEGAAAGLALLRDEPNYSASLPTKILEYMARGVPVICTPLPAAKAIVDKYHCGFVVPFDDPAAVSVQIERLLNDDSLRADLAANGRRAARDFYSWEQDAKKMIAFFEDVASGHVPIRRDR